MATVYVVTGFFESHLDPRQNCIIDSVWSNREFAIARAAEVPLGPTWAVTEWTVDSVPRPGGE